MNTSKIQAIRIELEQIQARANGLLRPADVVRYAREQPNSALHQSFEWDDSIAAEKYRIIRARELIQVHVLLPNRPDVKPVRAFCSLPEDRQRPGGGYRKLEQVLSDEQMRASLARQAKKDIEVLLSKYGNLLRLCDYGTVFDDLFRRADEIIDTAERGPSELGAAGVAS